MLLRLHQPLHHLQVLLHIEEKLFTYLHQAVFRENNGRAVSIDSYLCFTYTDKKNQCNCELGCLARIRNIVTYFR